MTQIRKKQISKSNNKSTGLPPETPRKNFENPAKSSNASLVAEPVEVDQGNTTDFVDAGIRRDQVVAVYLALLGREPESEDAIQYHMKHHADVRSFSDFVIATPESTGYLHRRMGLQTVDDVVAEGATLSDYGFFYFLMNKYFSVWHSTYLIVLASFQFINFNRREDLVKRFIAAVEAGDMARLLVGQEVNLIRQPPRFLPPLGVLERYQDVRVNGTTHASGVRGCEERFQFISSVASQFKRQFSVFDLGSNLGYFAVRLVEEFDCIVVCCEGTYANWLRAIVSHSARGRIVVLAKTLTIDDLEHLAECETFDLVLAMSVVHHVNAPVQRTMAALRKMAWKLVVEFPTEQTACGPLRVREALSFDFGTEGGTLLGKSFSHLPGDARPTFLFDGRAATYGKAYLGSPRPCNVQIVRDWEHAMIVKDGHSRPYLPALNFHTYLCFNGVWPVPAEIWADDLAALSQRSHGDIMPWNFLIHSGGLKAIDYNVDPNGFAYPDGLCLGLVKDIVSAASYIPDVPAEIELPLTPSGKSGDIITSGFNPTSPHSMRPASSGALVALHHAFVPGSSLNVMLSVQPSNSFEIAVFANNMACTLERDTANPTYDRLTIHVPSDVSLLNYPLLLRFEIKQLEPEATEMPDFYSLSYKLNDIAPH